MASPKTIDDVRKRSGCDLISHPRVDRPMIVGRGGEAMMRRGVRFVLEDPSALCSGYSAGVSGTELAAQLGVSKHTVYRLLKAQGVPLRASGRQRRQLDRVDIVLRYAQGWTLSAIAKRHHCYRPSIRRVLKDAGIAAFQDPKPPRVRRFASRALDHEHPGGPLLPPRSPAP